MLQLGEEDAAGEHFRAMLKLNPNDNQGIRYLLAWLLSTAETTPSKRRSSKSVT